MKKNFLFLFIFIAFRVQASVTICSWNLENFGKSKSESEIDFIANTLNKFDVVAILEVVAGDGGADAVSRLSDALNRKGTKWDYSISNPTSSTNAYKVERYAFLWKTAKIKKVGDAWLEKKFSLEIDREPYFANFKAEGKQFTLAAFHAITKSKQPETEIKYFKYIPAEYPDLKIIFCGDFNCPQSHSVFNPLKNMGYVPALVGQKTSLKQKCVGDQCLASEYDNFFYKKDSYNLLRAGIIAFYKSFTDLKEARKISDHVPIFLEVEWK
jgi:endonuclease/exonuclease/phosphatase family metal-dependent hydrolase